MWPSEVRTTTIFPWALVVGQEDSSCPHFLGPDIFDYIILPFSINVPTIHCSFTTPGEKKYHQPLGSLNFVVLERFVCISLIFSPETPFLNENIGSRVKISGKYKTKPSYLNMSWPN